MKAILSLIISGALVVSGYSQTRNVLVGTNNAVVQPTNFWSADASNARTGLGLGTAATNPASAFQPSSLILSNLASSNGANLTNIALSGVVGALATNGNAANLTNFPTVALASNVTGTIAISNGGSGATTAGGARTNLGLTLAALTNTSASNFRTAIGLGATNDVSFAKLNAMIDAGESNSTLFFSPISFDDIRSENIVEQTRTNLGLGASWLVSTNAPVFVNTNGEVVSPTNFWQAAPINTRVQISQPVVNATNNATNARNLFLYSLAISTTGVTNTIQLPTNGGTFLGDVATVIHEGAISSITAVRQTGAGSNLITLNQFQEAVQFIYESGGWRLADNLSYVEPIYFSGTNAAANAAASVTNLFTPNTPLVFATNGEVVANTGTNVLTFTNSPTAFSRIEVFGSTMIQSNAFEVYQPIWFGTRNGTNDIFQFEEQDQGIARTNLGLGLPALTNTNNAGFRTAIELGETNNVAFNDVVASGTLTATGSVTALSNVAVTGTLTATSTVTAKTNLVVEGFVDYTAARTNNTPTNIPNFAAHAAWIEVKIGTNSFFLPAYQ